MSSVGPQLPPSASLSKRKRDSSDSEDDRPSSFSERSPGTPESSSKRLRTIGPTLPPASLDERPPQSPSASKSSDSSDDDDFGPALPSSTTSTSKSHPTGPQLTQPAPSAPTARDEWMTLAPSSSDWSSRVDPTKLKSRKFNTGKGAKGPTVKAGGDTAWHETPAEKQERLRREVLGIREPGVGRGGGEEVGVRAEDAKERERRERVREFTEKSRGSTLYAEHQKSNPREKEDDPSARAFDREKDIAGGMKINTTQRKELMQKAGDFGSRFSSAKYL